MIQIAVHHYFHGLGTEEVTNKLDAILKMLRESKKREVGMSAQFDALKAKVAANTTVVGSALVLIDGLAQQIRDLKDDPAALEALAAELEATNTATAAKILENTPAAPPAP
jgi:hypothetical protein